MGSHEAYLRSALSKYRHPDLTKREVLGIFQSFSDLRPNVMNYVFNDGQKKELLCLDGTIPVTYKGKTYNIPISIYLMDTHPYNPPIIYVKPTPTMQIKQGRHVDAAGRVYLPYLHEWKHPSSDLLGLIQILAIVFGEEPPVFSKQQTTPATSSQPPYPMTQQPAGSMAPYPTTGVQMPMPNFATSSTPSYPPGSQYPPSQPYPGYPPSYPPQQPQPPYPGGFQQPYTAPYPGQAQPPYPTSTATQSAVTSGSNALSDEQIRLSLLSAVEDKMKRRLRETLAQAQAETDVLKKTQEDLQRGRQKLDDMLQKLEKEQNEVEKNIRLLNEKDEEIKTILEKMENREDVNIDDVVIPTAPLYKQLLNAFAEEQATEDAIYYMGEALRKGVIELDVFLKQVRELSRKQFMLRMLIHKCRQKAGLPDISG